MNKQKYDLFLSYNLLDAEIVRLLALELSDAGIKVWLDRWELIPGEPWARGIERAIGQSNFIGICIGPAGIARTSEIDSIINLSVQRLNTSSKIVPILLPDADPTDLSSEIAGRLFVDLRSGVENNEAVKRFASAIKKNNLALFESAYYDLSTQTSPIFPAESFAWLPAIPRPPVVGFVRRRDIGGRDVIERLKEELAPQRSQLVALWGPGGTGKTTLAAEAARALVSIFRQRIVWVSALSRTDFTLSTLLDGIATQLDRPELRPLAREPKAEQVQELIAAAPTLIVLDNFETISLEEQTRCLDFLVHRAACPALITTRSRIDEAYNIPLAAMSLEEAREFLQRLIKQMQTPSKFTELDADDLIHKCEANPLVLQWAIRQIDLAKQPQAVLNYLVEGEGDAVEQVFARSFNLPQVGEDGRAALLALALFVPSASREALAEVAGFDHDLSRLAEAIEHLAALWLVATSESHERLLTEGLTFELAKARLSRDKLANEFRERFVSYFLRYAEAHAQSISEAYDALEAEKDNLLGAIEVAFLLMDWSSVITIAQICGAPVTGMLSMRGYWDEAIRCSELAIVAAQKENNEWDVALFGANAATIRKNRGEYNEARRLYQQSLNAFRALKSNGNVAVALHQLAMIAHDQGELAEAQRLYHESLNIERTRGDQSGIARTLHNLGTLAESQGRLAEARRLYSESLEITRALNDPRSIAITLHQLGTITLGEGNLTEARRLYNESLVIKRNLGDQIGIATTLGQLGLLAEEEGSRGEAARLMRVALDIFEKLKSPYAETARRNLERLEKEGP